MFMIFFSFSSFQYPRQKVSKTEVVQVIFYSHQTSGKYAGVCAYHHMHQMEKTGSHDK